MKRTKLPKVKKPTKASAIKDYIKTNLPYYGGIVRKHRYKDQIKDKAWSLLSDYVRCRDFVKYGTCVATGHRMEDWREGDAGHYHTMAGNGATIGFSDLNVHLQRKISNKLSSAADGAYFEKELIRRYGEGIIPQLCTLKQSSIKADNLFFIKKIQEIWPKFRELKAMWPDCNYPEYLNK